MDEYDTDVLTWSERQAALLRRVAAGEQINDQIDWPNIIEEVEAVGQSQVHAVESWLYQALLHDAEGRGVAVVGGRAALAGRSARLPCPSQA